MMVVANEPFGNNSEMQQYFSSLPVYVQENIMMTGVQLNSLEELRQCAENMLQDE